MGNDRKAATQAHNKQDEEDNNNTNNARETSTERDNKIDRPKKVFRQRKTFSFSLSPALYEIKYFISNYPIQS
jgi:hypothetical protein